MASDSVSRALARYDETLLRAVSGRLFKPRNQWPVDELVTRAVETLSNPPVIDRRLKELSPSCRALLAAIGLTRRYEWAVGQLIELLSVLGHAEGLAPILTLLDAGLFVPIAPESIKSLRKWEDWLGIEPMRARLLVPSGVAERALREGTGLPQLPGKRFDAKSIQVADGLEWLLRLGVLWQQLRIAPIRLTQANALFKRDHARLQSDPLLATPVGDQQVESPDIAALVMAMGAGSGLFVAEGGELRAGSFPAAWEEGLIRVIAGLWSALPAIDRWDPVNGYLLGEGNTAFPTAALGAMLLLTAQPEGIWTHPSDIDEYLRKHHSSWAVSISEDDGEAWVEAMFFSWAIPSRLVETTQDGEGWWMRLTNIGRHLLAGAAAPDVSNHFPRCLVVQPNGDVIAYRQGLTPELIARLSQFADWRMIGPACTLGLSAESVYRGLESGLTLTDILGVLQQHSGHPVPANVLDLIRRWAGKRERITVHTAATLLEFNTPGELEAAVARGLIVHKITDRIGLANGELDYKHFRLLGNRDYEAKPQKCVTFDRDGVTFTVDAAAADLLLESEVARLAEPMTASGAERRFRLTPDSARTAKHHGWTASEVEEWCLSRTGEKLSASARLLFAEGAPAELHRRLVLTLASEEVTDGIWQWPETATLLLERLGPRSVTVNEEDLQELRGRLANVGITFSDLQHSTDANGG